MPSASYYEQLIQSSPNLQKFLSLIGWAEGANYNVGFGGRVIPDLSWHPYQIGAIRLPNGKTTSAAGKYQFERRTWNNLASQLGLTNFSPQSQDVAAVALLDQSGQLNNVLNGNVSAAVSGLGNIWESFKVKPLQSIVNHYYNGSAPSWNAQGQARSNSSSSNDLSKYMNVEVIGAQNRYLIAFAILVIIFIFAFN